MQEATGKVKAQRGRAHAGSTCDRASTHLTRTSGSSSMGMRRARPSARQRTARRARMTASQRAWVMTTRRPRSLLRLCPCLLPALVIHCRSIPARKAYSPWAKHHSGQEATHKRMKSATVSPASRSASTSPHTPATPSRSLYGRAALTDLESNNSILVAVLHASD